ncbi:MAG: lysophospholipid acyltransferase family protein, partial [Chloroflexota bacterium]|nr:lysophospholipid acyltransferase family protein [Chloroflexota bacterium]
FMAKEELFRNPFMKAMVHWAHGFSAHRRGSVEDKRKTINQAKNILSEGQVLGMFPEGTRNHVGKLLPGKPGAAAFAAQMDVPLLPVGIAGTEKIRGISCLWKRPHVVINMGQPFKLPPIKGRLSRSQARALTDITMKKIAALLPAENRGVYAD